jgi:hypothetical protein
LCQNANSTKATTMPNTPAASALAAERALRSTCGRFATGSVVVVELFSTSNCASSVCISPDSVLITEDTSLSFVVVVLVVAAAVDDAAAVVALSSPLADSCVAWLKRRFFGLSIAHQHEKFQQKIESKEKKNNKERFGFAQSWFGFDASLLLVQFLCSCDIL